MREGHVPAKRGHDEPGKPPVRKKRSGVDDGETCLQRIERTCVQEGSDCEGSPWNIDQQITEAGSSGESHRSPLESR